MVAYLEPKQDDFNIKDIESENAEDSDGESDT
jgi:hypothetical protein